MEPGLPMGILSLVILILAGCFSPANSQEILAESSAAPKDNPPQQLQLTLPEDKETFVHGDLQISGIRIPRKFQTPEEYQEFIRTEFARPEHKFAVSISKETGNRLKRRVFGQIHDTWHIVTKVICSVDHSDDRITTSATRPRDGYSRELFSISMHNGLTPAQFGEMFATTLASIMLSAPALPVKPKLSAPKPTNKPTSRPGQVERSSLERDNSQALRQHYRRRAFFLFFSIV